MTDPLVIIGGGLASAGAVRAIRDGGHDGDVVVISTEPHHPYERPPLSKDYLRREATRSSVFTLAPDWYAEHHVDVRSIDRCRTRSPHPPPGHGRRTGPEVLEAPAGDRLLTALRRIAR